MFHPRAASVIAIGGLLASLVAPRYFDSVGKSNTKIAKAQIDALEKALDQLRLDVGRYPTTEQGLESLYTKPPNLERWAGPYLKKPVPLDPWGRGHDLHRHMAIAQMPGQAHQLMRIAGANFGQGFGTCHHFHQASVIQPQGIAAAQAGCFMQVQCKCQPAQASQRKEGMVALGEIQDNRIGSRFVPATLGLDRDGFGKMR